jgi:hypothetical protein
MLPIGSEFTPFERAVLSVICEMHPQDRPLLEAQLSTATFRRRDNTGVGFFTYLEVGATASRRPEANAFETVQVRPESTAKIPVGFERIKS